MDERRSTFYNALASVTVQITSIIVALIIPRLIILAYGSSINGFMSSVNQIVSYFSLVEGGVAVSAGAALYIPFAKNDKWSINRIMTSVNRFYKKTGIVVGLVLVSIAVFYGSQNIEGLKPVDAFFATLAIGMSSVMGYMFFNKYTMLLMITKRHYITLVSSSIYYAVVTVAQVILVRNNAPILSVFFVYPVFALPRLIWIKQYIKNKYRFLNFHGSGDDKAISQKYNALMVNISQLAKTVIPIITLTLLYNLRIVSVYTIHATIFHVGSSILETFGNGMAAVFGYRLASANSGLNRAYDKSKLLVVYVVSLISLCFLTLTDSFIKIYTNNVTDVDYTAVMLVITMTINEALINLRFSSKTMIKAGGQFKGAMKSGVAELLLCCVLTPVSCLAFGWEYVMLGSILASILQLIYYEYVVMTHYGYRYQKDLIVSCALCPIFVVILFVLLRKTQLVYADSLLTWIKNAFIIFSLGLFTFGSCFLVVRSNCVRQVKSNAKGHSKS